MLNGTRVIDADGHLNDWHLDWERLLPPDLGPGATRSVRDRQGFPHLQVDGMLLPGSERDDLDYHVILGYAVKDLTMWHPSEI